MVKIAEILLEKVCNGKNRKKMGCQQCLWFLLHGNEKNVKKAFLGQRRWWQIPTPVLPIMRKSMIWNLPNPMVSTASSTVNVFWPKHEKKIKTQKVSAVRLYLVFIKNIFHATVGLHQEKAWKHLPVVCPLTSPWMSWWHNRGLLKQQTVQTD